MPPFHHSNPHIRQQAGQAVDHSRQPRMTGLKFLDRRLQSADGMPEHLRILAFARGLAGRDLSQGSDAFGLFLLRRGERSDFSFKLAEQLEQFRAVPIIERGGILNPTLNFRNSVLQHRDQFSLSQGSGKTARKQMQECKRRLRAFALKILPCPSSGSFQKQDGVRKISGFG